VTIVNLKNEFTKYFELDEKSKMLTIKISALKEDLIMTFLTVLKSPLTKFWNIIQYRRQIILSYHLIWTSDEFLKRLKRKYNELERIKDEYKSGYPCVIVLREWIYATL